MMLRHIILCYFLVIFSIFSYSENEYAKQGTIEGNGGLSFNYNKKESANSLNFYLTPTLNYFFIDHFYLGISPILTITHKEDSTRSYLNPAISIGHVIPLNSSYYWYFSLNSGLVLSFPERVSQPLNYNLSFESGLKTRFGDHGLAILGVHYTYYIPISRSFLSRYSVRLILGFGIYFDTSFNANNEINKNE